MAGLARKAILSFHHRAAAYTPPIARLHRKGKQTTNITPLLLAKTINISTENHDAI